jgi:hypothetical protein
MVASEGAADMQEVGWRCGVQEDLPCTERRDAD